MTRSQRNLSAKAMSGQTAVTGMQQPPMQIMGIHQNTVLGCFSFCPNPLELLLLRRMFFGATSVAESSALLYSTLLAGCPSVRQGGQRVAQSFEAWGSRLAWMLLSRRSTEKPRGHRRVAPRNRVPRELFRASVHRADDVDCEGSSPPASFPSSPRARATLLRENDQRCAAVLAASRELLRIEIRCVRASEDPVSLRVAKVLRRRRLAPMLDVRSATRDVVLGPDGLVAVRSTARDDLALARSAAPLPPRVLVYFEVAWDGETDDLCEVSCGLAPRDHRPGRPGAVVLSSLGSLLVDRSSTSIDDDVSPCLTRVLFGPKDVLGVLAYHDVHVCRVAFAVNAICVGIARLKQPRPALLFPTLVFRSRHVAARCAFSADQFGGRAKPRLAALLPAVADAFEPFLESPASSIYALDGTRVVGTSPVPELPR